MPKLSPAEVLKMLMTGAKLDAVLAEKTDYEVAEILYQAKGDQDAFGPVFGLMETAELRLRRANGGPISRDGMHDRVRLVIEFDNVDYRKEFIGWFMDGGGEQQFAEVQEMNGMEAALSNTVDGASGWPWQGDTHEDAPQYTIAITTRQDPVPEGDVDGGPAKDD